jgi:hypothetical protein
MKPYIIVGYFTIGTLYEARAKILQKSLERFDVPYHVTGVPNLGSWQKNTSYKPTFLKRMIRDFAPSNIVYVDVDAEFQRYPDLFDTLDTTMSHDVAVYVFDRSCYRRSPQGTEVLSGTIFFRNAPGTNTILDAWELRCRQQENVWDQKHLEYVLKDQYDLLPGEYCKIFDRMEEITDPVIVHYQASREVRRHRGRLTIPS